jgi:hypothetical protein
LRKPSTKEIERYILDPASISPVRADEIRKWIDSDAEIRELAEWLETFYGSVDQIRRQKKIGGKKPKLINLVPYKTKIRQKNGFVLAAQTPAVKKLSGLKTLITFSSEAYKTLIRVLHDLDRNEYRLHVLSEFVDEEDIVIIDIPEANLSVISDKGGVFKLEEDEIEQDEIINWKNCRLHLPLTKAEVYYNHETGDLNVDTSAVNPDQLILSFQIGGDRLRVKADVKDDRKIEKCVIRSGGYSSMIPVQDNISDFPLDKLTESSATLFFY